MTLAQCLSHILSSTRAHLKAHVKMLEKSHELMCTISKLTLALMYTSMPDGNTYMNHLPSKLTNANGHEFNGFNIKTFSRGANVLPQSFG
jgi:hypothetical protein